MEEKLFPLDSDSYVYRSAWFQAYCAVKPIHRRIKNDTYLISYPKSGRTWVRMFLAKYLSELQQTPFQLRLEAPPYTVNIKKWKDRPRLIFHHMGYKQDRTTTVSQEEINFFLQNYKYRQMIFLLRDPRDVLVSHYYHLKARRRLEYVKDMNLSDFVRDEYYGIKSIVQYFAHWYEFGHRYSNVNFFRYEDLRETPELSFAHILRILNIRHDAKCLKLALDFSSFDNLQKLEKKKVIKSGVLQRVDDNDPNSAKVRKGIIGGYLYEMNSDDIAYCDTAMKKIPEAFGYEYSR